jgi:hypothetical protein
MDLSPWPIGLTLLRSRTSALVVGDLVLDERGLKQCGASAFLRFFGFV